MNKKIIAISFFIIFIFSFIPANGITIQKEENKCRYSDKSYFDIYPTMIESEIKIDSYGKATQKIIDTPSEFKWFDYNGKNWLTPVKRQLCGDCWDYAALGTLESIIKIRENCSDFNPDLSEQYVLSCLPKAGSCNGGNSYLALKLINETSENGNFCNGVVLEDCFPYQASDDIPCEDKCVDWKEKLVPISDYGMWFSNNSKSAREQIKTYIMKNGPVVTHIYATPYFKHWGSKHHKADDYFHYSNPKVLINHVVVLVGWKDDPNIKRGGYWICKNSWGTDWGYNGFFNIEYGTLNIDKFIVFVDYDPESYDWDPVASAGSYYYADLGEEIIFNGSKSCDADSLIKNYSWDFGDGVKNFNKIAFHTYLERGIFNVTLTVTDYSGNKDTDKAFVWIDTSANPPEKPTMSGPKKVRRNKEYIYSLKTNDPENDDVFYQIDWGEYYDTKDWIGPYKSGEKVNIKKTWSSSGKQDIKIRAKDIYGLESDWESLSLDNSKTKIQDNFLFEKLGYKISKFLFNSYISIL